MVLAKSDLSAIRTIVKQETLPHFQRLTKKIKKIDGKLNEHFNFVDKDVSYFRKKTADHLGIPVSDLIRTSG